MVNLTSHNVEEITHAKFWLVLVGINSYQDSQIPNLRYCAKDCKALAETLKIATAGFWQTEIIALYDEGEKSPNQSNILESIQIFRKAKPEDLVLFYFSGHGYLDNNRPILCVADTNFANLAATGLKLDTLLGELRQCQAKRQLVWLDACQEQYQDKYHPNPTSQLLVILNEQAEQSQDFSAMLSCDKNERSWEIPELKHGLFTYCLIEGLKGKAANPEGQISADSLFYYVKDSSYKYIECKKNIARVNDVSKGIGGTLKKASNQLKVNRFSVNISQTPQTIIRGGGGRDLLIGLAKQYNQRKALIIDQLSSSATQIKLCKILKTKGNFEVEYCYLQSQLEQKIASYLETNQQTFILYLAGTITLNQVGESELKCGQNKLINLNWLGERLRTSPVEEIIVIADLVNENGQIEDLTNIFKPDQNKSLCLITSTTSESNQRKFLDQLINILTIAGTSNKEFWLIELITQLQQWSQSQSDLNLRLWLPGSLEVREILTVEVQRSDNNVFTLNLCPYKSLQAFNQDDAYFFHGREELIREIINKFQSTDFLGIVGASGSGKSSVVKAGVIPQLLTQGLFSLTLNKYQSCQCWVIIPGDNPLGTLVKTLGINNSNLDSDSFSYWLKQQSQEISILVIDQFEELFTLTAEKDKKSFLNIILETIKKTRESFRVIITLRSDFLDQCLRMSELAPLISKSQVLVPSCRLEDEQYRQMIVQPAQKVGLEVEEGLIALLLKELTEGSLPLLQYALEELWQKRSQGKLTLQDYQKHIGKLGKFLSNKAQETYDKLNKYEKECAQFIFLSLVFLAKNKEELNKETRNRIPLYTLQIDKYKNVLDSTLKALIKARLVVVNREENNPATQEQEKTTVEIAHEIILQDWETLKEWLDTDRQKYRFIKEIEHKADEWKVNGKQDDFLLSKGALAKYEEFYLNHANYLGPNSQELINASIRARKRRKLLLRGSVTGFIVLISMALIATLWQLRQATNNEIKAQIALSNAQFAFNQRLSAVVEGVKALKELQRLQKWNFATKDTQTRVIEAFPQLIYGVRESNRIEGHNDKLEDVRFNSDGTLMATASADHTVKIWTTEGKLVGNLEGHRNWVNSISFSPDGTQIVTVSSDQTIKIWQLDCVELEGDRCIRFNEHISPKTLTNHTGWVMDINFSPDGQTFATVSLDGTVKLWSFDGLLLQDIPIETEVWGVSFNPDGQIIAIALGNGNTHLLTLDGTIIKTLTEHSERVRDVSFSRDGELLVSVSDDDTAIIWTADGTLLQRLEHQANVNRVSFSHDSQKIATVSDGDNENVKLWTRDGILLNTFNGHTAKVKGVNFSPDGQTLATASWDSTLRLWSLVSLMPKTLEKHHDDNRVMTVNFSPDGELLVSASWNENPNQDQQPKTIILWTSDGTFVKTLEYNQGANVASFSPDGTMIATGSAGRDTTVKLWDRQGNLIATLDRHQDYIRDLSWSRDSQMLVTASGDSTAILWTREGEFITQLIGHEDAVYGVSFSPDGEIIATGSKDNDIKLWTKEGQEIKTLERQHSNWIWKVIFSPDGQLIASASEDSTVKLWQRDGTFIKTLREHTDRVSDIAFSPTSDLIATGSADTTIKLWTTDGQLLTTLEGHNNRVMSVSFSPDGKVLVSSSVDGEIKLWNLNNFLFTSDLDILLINGCNWIGDYLTYNPNLSEEDRKICDGIDS